MKNGEEAEGKSEGVTLDDLKDKLAIFAKERDWDQLHSPRNLLLALVFNSLSLFFSFCFTLLTNLLSIFSPFYRTTFDHKLFFHFFSFSIIACSSLSSYIVLFFLFLFHTMHTSYFGFSESNLTFFSVCFKSSVL